ncbi:MAG: amino acid ABC transporter permease [Clostridiales Family XIII bacterium]|jgi:polar amino acid transport system permease protein|nr:amino acid ABC transporter permease [Clostridiales Family XIII bacterium]
MDFDYLSKITFFIMKGTGVTLQIYVVTLVFSIPLGIICAIGKISRFKALRAVIWAYTWLFRGTPLLLQLVFFYYGLTAMTGGYIQLKPLSAAFMAFSINYGAYFTEIFRSGIQSVSKGQYEAAKALGMSPWQTMRRVVLPQAVKVVLPPMGNEAITLIKDTALCSVITVTEILRNSQVTVARDARVDSFLVAAAIYLCLTFAIMQVFRVLEKRFAYYKS